MHRSPGPRTKSCSFSPKPAHATTSFGKRARSWPGSVRFPPGQELPRPAIARSERMTSSSFAPPAKLKLQLVEPSGPLVLDVEFRVARNAKRLSRHAYREWAFALDRLRQPPELRGELAG